MNRQERDRYDYGRYEGYENDEHYHGARNLTNEFEQHYRGERGDNYDSDRRRPQRSYHEGSEIEDTYNRQNHVNRNDGDRSGNMRQERDTNYFGHYNDNQDNYRGDEDFYREGEGRDNNRPFDGRGVSSSFEDDYGSYSSGRYTGTRDQDHTYGNRSGSRDSRYSSDSNQGFSYRSGSPYTGNYRSDDESRYSSDRDRNRNNRWNNSEDMNRYY